MDIDKAKRVVNLWRDARGLDAPIPWETTLARFIADALAAERRAGIEAAAQAVAGEREEIDPSNWNDALDAALRAIRALADKPAPDALLVGIEYVREHLRTDGNAVRLIAWLDAEIAARKGG